MDHANVQRIAKKTLEYLKKNVTAGMLESDVVKIAENFMIENGITSFWYYGIGAFVFTGERTVLSVSGRDYIPTNTIIQSNDIITIDLSPQVGGVWGDYARTLVIQNGEVIDTNSVINFEHKSGLDFEEMLHETLLKIAYPDMTFEELYFLMNDIIKENDFVNLDFLGNLGHSIESNIESRKYIEKGNCMRLQDAMMFTFEPHIKKSSGKYGYKMENIYYFSNGLLLQL